MASHRDPGTEREGHALSARASSRLAKLEAALAHAQEERHNQASLVEAELTQLSTIYEQLKTRYQHTRQERDRARRDARKERERRARETLELSQRLAEAEKGRGEGAGAALPDSARERFVQDRLATSPQKHQPLAEGELPEVPGFVVLEQIGRGGMASVFHARRQSDALDVAIKLLDLGRGSSRTRTALFLREAAMMMQLEHPSLLRAYDAGDCRHGPYLVLQLVLGRSLSSRVRRHGPLAESEVVQIALEIGRALRYCARLGLTHRDVKPSNILQETSGELRLCDFGLAALSKGDAGHPYGSPGYAAPEQLATPDRVDERADIYALGCSMWHLAVGRRPFPGPPKKAFEIARTTDLPDPRFEGADVSSRLAQVIRRMSRSERSRRYRSWDECLLDLTLVERGNPPFAAHLADALAPGNDASRGAQEGGSSSTALPPTESAVSAESSAETGAVRGTETCASTPASPADLSAPADTRRAGLFEQMLHDGRVLVLTVACLLSALVGAQLGASLEPSAVERLEHRARALAARGRGAEAAQSLRQAAGLLPREDAAHLEEVADELLGLGGR